MSYERFFRWTCDVHPPDALVKNFTIEKPGYGLPEGWVAVPTGVEGIIHKCQFCASDKERSDMAKFNARFAQTV